MSQAISGHNRKILNSSTLNTDTVPPKQCNCRKPSECPLDNHCLEECVIYEASVSSEEGCKQYLGLTEGPFKTRFNQHKASFAHASKASDTALSKYVWDLKQREANFEIKWRVVEKCQPYRCGTRRCDLCLTEKFHILNADKDKCLNRNSELLQKCRHSNKYKLGCIT